MLVVSSLRPGFSVDSESIQAGVSWVTPIRQHPHLNDLESPVILLLEQKRQEGLHIRINVEIIFISNRLEKRGSAPTVTGKVCSDSPSSWYV